MLPNSFGEAISTPTTISEKDFSKIKKTIFFLQVDTNPL